MEKGKPRGIKISSHDTSPGPTNMYIVANYQLVFNEEDGFFMLRAMRFQYALSAKNSFNPEAGGCASGKGMVV
jgi:hypothetical protein